MRNEGGKKERRIFTMQKCHLLVIQCCILCISEAIFQITLKACVAELINVGFYAVSHYSITIQQCIK